MHMLTGDYLVVPGPRLAAAKSVRARAHPDAFNEEVLLSWSSARTARGLSIVSTTWHPGAVGDC